MDGLQNPAEALPLTAEDMTVGLTVAEVGLGTVDYRADTVRFDTLAARFFDLPAGTDLPRDTLHDRIHPDDWPAVAAKLDDLLAPACDSRVVDISHRIVTGDGSIRWVNARKQVRFDADAKPLHGVFALVDITARIRAEEQARFLIGELNHRSKNLITVVAGIARQISRHCDPQDMAAQLNDRLTALARNQDAIVNADTGSFELRDIFTRQLAPFCLDTGRRVTLTGPALALSSSASQIVAMVAHELITNAMKHGALSDEAGQVAVSWTVGADDCLELHWAETGGPAISPPMRNGFGTEVLTTLTETSLGAEVSRRFDPDGFRLSLRAPIDRLR
ncbi:HWE histidine kinase domain-containing protein [Lutimaribacter marinistellae]|uniref:histidine kinase n=1 Tax=Lutimaribacter marinistellae TaxID=1820329 RepID=A0ABV7TL57_9RHOB